MQLRPFIRAGFTAALLLGSLAGGAGSAWSQDLNSQVQRLRDDLNRLQRDYYQNRGGIPPAGGAAASGPDMGGDVANRLSGRIDQIDEQIRSLTGRSEELDYRVAQIQRRLDKLVEDVDFRLSAIEKAMAERGGAAVAGAPPAAPPTVAGSPATPAPANAAANRSSDPSTAVKPEGNLGTLVVTGSGSTVTATQSPNATLPTPPPARAAARTVKLPTGTAQEQYNYAFGLLRQGDYGEAEQAFNEFIGANQGDPLAGNAQYWLGETYYVRKDWQSAATTFLAGYQKYPKGNKAPDSLVKLGMTLTNLNQKPEACAAFGQFNKEFPQAPVALKQLAQTERGRAGCK